MHNKLLINIGFYLLLIFAFSVSIFPPVAYAAAAGLMVLWMMDLLIFREPEFTDMPLYYPILGFLAIFLVSWIVARLYGSYNDFIYLALLSIFYFIVPGFVVTNEQRRMVLWTFAAGILLYSGTKLVIFWSSLTQPGRESIEIGNSHIALITLAVCVLIAFFAESRGLFERLFQAFVCLPLIILILAAKDNILIIILAIIIMAVALFRDRRLLIPIVLAGIFVVLDLGGIGYYVERNFNIAGLRDLILMPAKLAFEPGIIFGATFFGAQSVLPEYTVISATGNSFFLDLIRSSGPPAFLTIVFIFIERARESYFLRRKVTLREEKAYHLTVLLMVIALFLLNLYCDGFTSPGAVLAAWMIMGIDKV